jgi:hypothetical protein
MENNVNNGSGSAENPSKHKNQKASAKNKKQSKYSWPIKVGVLTLALALGFGVLSEVMLSDAGIILAIAVIVIFLFISIVFDTVGVAVTSADESPFHSMAARKVPGAQESIKLLRNAERVSSICNDVIGDICGVVSGSASAAIAAQVLENFQFSWPRIITLLMSALVAGLTVGGKAIGKTFAINSCTKIVHAVGKIIWSLRNFPTYLKRNKN